MGSEHKHDPSIALMRQGRWAAAAAALEAAVRDDADDAEALRLLGTVHHVCGRGDQALALLERALQLLPDEPRTLLNLGNVHLAADRLSAARACYERLVIVQPAAADGHYSLGLLAQRGGDLQSAAGHYADALARDPGALDAAVNLAAIHLRQRRHELAAAQAAQILERQPGHPQAHLLRLRALTETHRMAEADQALAAAQGSLPASAELHHAAGLLHHRNGRLAQAAASYRAAQALGDERLATVLGLARCLLEAGEADAAAQALQASAPRLAASAEARELLAVALHAAGDLPAALAACEAALAIAPQAPGALGLRPRLLFELGRDEAAAGAESAAMNLAPGQPGVHMARVERCIARGDRHAALQACEAYLRRYGPQADLLAARGFLLQALGRAGEAARLIDHDRLIAAELIEAPPGHADVAAFNAALCRHLRAHPSLSAEGAATKATQHGRQSGNLFFGERGPFADFETLLWAAARRYLAAHPRDPGHPFLATPPPLGGVHCWAVVLQRAGHQTPHIHPTGWLSGVYYPALPALLSEQAPDDQSGWIEFGAAPPELACEPALPTYRLRPREGLLLLFPSYFYHRTLPYQSDEERVSIAFDFTPGRPA